MPCSQCGETIQVICIYCEYGKDLETAESLARFTLSNVWALDGALAAQLERWPFFRKGVGAIPGDEGFANDCPFCDARQEDYLLHEEPGDVFFGIAQTQSGMAEFTPLMGRVQMSGDWR